VAAVRVASAGAWGRLVDGCGARPVLVVCSLGIAVVPLIWLFPTADRLWPIAIEAVVSGALWGGHGIAAFDLSIGVSPRRGRPYYLAAFATAGGLGFAASSIVAGVLASMLASPLHAAGLSGSWMHVLFLPRLLREPRVAQQLARARDVLVVELDADVARQAVGLGIRAREPDEFRLRNGHALTLEGQVDRALLDDRVGVVAPWIVVHEDVDGQPVLFVQTACEPPHPSGRLAVARQQHAVVASPELVLREPIPLRALLDEQDEVGGAPPDLHILRLDDRRHG